MAIFWNKYGILVTEYVPRGTTVSGPYYASIIERLHCVILEKCRGKLVMECCFFMPMPPFTSEKLFGLLFERSYFVESNHPVCSLDIAPSDSYLFSNLKKFLRGKNFSADDETVDTVFE